MNKRTTVPSDNDYRTREDLHVLRHHAEIKADPKRHAAAVALAKHEREMLAKIQKPRVVKKAGGK